MQRARVGQRAVRLPLDVTLLFPLLEVAKTIQLGGVLHPLDDLEHRHEVHVVPAQHLLDELDQFLPVLLLALQPRGVEVQPQGGAVGV